MLNIFSDVVNPALGSLLIKPIDFIHHAFIVGYLSGQTVALLCLYAIISLGTVSVIIAATISICILLGLLFLFVIYLVLSSAGKALQLLIPKSPTPLPGHRSSSFLEIFFTCLVSLTSYVCSPMYAIQVAMEARNVVDGYCYVLLFPRPIGICVALCLGKNPYLDHVAFFQKWLPGNSAERKVSVVNGVVHISTSFTPEGRLRIGSRLLQQVNELLDGLRTAQPFGSNRPSFLPGPRPTKQFGGLKTKTKKEVMNGASALASGAILLGREAMSGANAENLVYARDVLDGHAVRTHIPPSNKKYKRLVESLGIPLDYVPATSAHEEAATCRRAWMKKMVSLTTNSVVLMISPSHNEWHANPNGLAIYPALVDGLDAARIARPCGSCKAPRCDLLAKAVDEDRVLMGSTEQQARKAFYYRVDCLWLLNIEPNVPVRWILEFMVAAEIRYCLSATHADWRAIGTGNSHCSLTGMNTRYIGNQVVAGFDESGEYSLDKDTFEAMFRPVSNATHSLRRTIIGRAGSSLLTEIHTTDTGFARPFVPDRHENYLIPIPHPRSGVTYLRVEKDGFDRTLQLFRTTPNPSVATARIAIRQSNVTYSISGTALTSRLSVSGSDSEFLAMWMYVYSCAMAKAEASLSALDFSNQANFFSILSKHLVNDESNDAGLFNSKAAAQKWVSICASNGALYSLDEISDRAYDCVYGSELGIGKHSNRALALWEDLVARSPTLAFADTVAKMSKAGVWSEVFSSCATVSALLTYFGLQGEEAIVIFLELAATAARGLTFTNWAYRIECVLAKIQDTDFLPKFAETISALKEGQSMDFVEAAHHIVTKIGRIYSLSVLDNEVPTLALTPEGAEEARRRGLFSGKSVFGLLTSDLSRILSKIRGRSERRSFVKTLLEQSDEEVGRCDMATRELLTRLVEEMPAIVAEAEKVSKSVAEEVSISQYPVKKIPVQGKPVPMEIVHDNGNNGMTIERAFETRAVLNIDYGRMVAHGHTRTLERLPQGNDGKVSFEPIHRMMEEAIPGITTTVEPIIIPPGQYAASSDEIGSVLLQNIISSGIDSNDRQPICSTDEMLRWSHTTATQPAVATPGVTLDWLDREGEGSGTRDMKGFVTRCLSKVPATAQSEGAPYVCHIEGLAMAGKSAGIRPILTKEDLVVVPSRDLKKDWEDSLAELPEDQRPMVLTQHKALGVSVSGKVIVDEVYQFDAGHREALRRTKGATCFITIGDSGQISNPLSEEPAMDYSRGVQRCVLVFPTTFCPFDVAYTYLREGTHAVSDIKRFFCGSSIARGLYYDIESDDKALAGKGDLNIQALQRSKLTMKNNGAIIRNVSAHESQGMRSNNTFIHAMANRGLCPDLAFFSDTARRAWYLVAITRARNRTTFIVPDRETAIKIPYIDITGVNGTAKSYSQHWLSAGTHFDLYDAVTVETVDYTRSSNPVTQWTDLPPNGLELSGMTLGSFIEPETNEAISRQEIYSDIDVSFATKATLNVPLKPFEPDGDYSYNPSHVLGAVDTEIASERTSKPERPITARDFREADKIVKEMFDKILDPSVFFQLAALDHSSINKHPREKFLERALADPSEKSSAMSYAFGKNESSKSQVILNEGSKLKLLAVLGMPPAQLALFDELVEALSAAFCFSMRPGIISPFRRTKMDINDVLGSFDGAFELDLNRQDASHERLHVAVFLRFVEMVAKRQGMADIVEAIRVSRRVRTLSHVFIFLQGCGLGSGDSWTLISNMIMAFTTLLAQYEVKRGQVRLQVGDDVTEKEKLEKRDVHIIKLTKPSWKVDNNLGKSASFTSRTSVTPTTAIPVRIRGIVNALTKKRGPKEHEAYKVSISDFLREISEIGVPAFTELHSDLWRATKYESEPDSLENIISAAYRLCETPYDSIPESLKASTPSVQVFSSSSFCFSSALARVLPNNVAAGNAIADRWAYENVPVSKCVEACEANNVPFIIIPAKYGRASQKQKKSGVKSYILKHGARSGIILFEDHALAVRPSEKLDFSIIKWAHVNVLLHEVTESETAWL